MTIGEAADGLKVEEDFGDEDDFRRRRGLPATKRISGDEEDFRRRKPSVPGEESWTIGGGVKWNR